MLIIFTGNGKGKTTAALGQAMRAVGNGSKVLMVQFIKGPWKSGEHESSQKLSPQFKIVKMGKGFVGILNDALPLDDHKKAAEKALSYALEEAKSDAWDIIILDEVWNALKLDLIEFEAVSDFITEATPYVDHLIMTGRDCPAEFVERADLVTEMKEVKHPFMHGVTASKSMEY